MTKYEELANLIFPDVTMTLDDLEKKYPKRDLPQGAMVTRFAPSPTGFLHTGSLFAAMVAHKFAKQSDGVFYTRLEDTDQKREIAGSGETLIKQLEVFGIIPDEGYMSNGQKGSYGPYVQSERAGIYKIVIKHMLKHDMAYPCFCSPDDLSVMRKNQEENKENFGYYGKYAKCSSLSPDECIARIKNNDDYVIRFRSQGDYRNRVVVEDLIRGRIEIAQNDQHIVILKSDGLPTYHFAHLVDDHFMRTTHVSRGEEWLPSLPIHIELFIAMGYDVPQYAHLPVIMKLDEGNRRKLSKRKDPEAAVSFFLEQGYPVEGFMEYLYTIANSNYELWREDNRDIKKETFGFSFEKMSLDGALFDLAKIQNLCKECLGNMSTEEFFKGSREWALIYDKEFYNLIIGDEDYYRQIISIEREQEKPRKDYEKYSDIKEMIKFFYDKYYDEMKKSIAFPSNISTKDASAILNRYCEIFDLDLSEEEWFLQLKEIAREYGFAEKPKDYKKNPEAFKGHVGDIASLLRVIVSLRLQSPNLYYIMKIIGRERIIARIRFALGLLN